jgi:RNA polymerase-binding transcription factor
MTNLKSRFDQAFLDRQKRRLTDLRKQLLGVREGQQSEQVSANASGAGQASAYEDDAQKLTTLELQGNLAAVDNVRLSNIARALQKIADGTYGLSDGSGAPIPVERLEVSPEALYTVKEQESRDSAR